MKPYEDIPDQLMDEAWQRAKNGDPLSAIRALESDPGTLSDYRRQAVLAHFHYLMDQFDTAQAYAEKALDLNQRSRLALVTLGEIFYRRKQFEKAIQFYEDAFRMYPQDDYATVRLGRILIERNQHDRALSVLEQARCHHPQNPEILDLLELTFLMSGNGSALFKLRSERKENQEGAGDRVIRNFLDGIQSFEPGKAIEQILKVLSIQVYADSIPLYEKLADLYVQVKQYDEAVICLQWLMERKPRVVSIRYRLVSCLIRLARIDEAFELLGELKQHHKSDRMFQLLTAEALAGAGRLQESMDCAVRLVLQYPKDKRLLNLIKMLRKKSILPSESSLEVDSDTHP